MARVDARLAPTGLRAGAAEIAGCGCGRRERA